MIFIRNMIMLKLMMRNDAGKDVFKDFGHNDANEFCCGF